MKNSDSILLTDVTSENWRGVIALEVNELQTKFVASASFYLLLCHYEQIWHPKAILLNHTVIGFLMWAIDPQDNSGWIGGFFIDTKWQGKGYGKHALNAILSYFQEQYQLRHFALSVQPQNPAIQLYESIGFHTTDEWEGDEIVMRLILN